VFGIAFAAEEDIFPGYTEGFVDEEAFEEGRSQAHSRVCYVIFTFDEVLFFSTDEGECFPGLVYVSWDS
jgi:hypothetical protein